MSDEDKIFLEAMGDVQPLKAEKRIQSAKVSASTPGLEVRRQAATALGEQKADGLSESNVPALTPYDLLEFKRDGIQHGVFRNLRLGKYTIEARLDMHRMTVAVARSSILQFIDDCVEHDVRCALITHGKGENRQPQPALLKSHVAHWLPQIDSVMAYSSAQKHHGGTGSTYVLLKKSEKKRLENSERHQKKS